MNIAETRDRGTVVVCEDDRATLELLCDNLSADRYRTLPAPSASDALRLCHYDQPDLLLLDLVLPDAGGLDVLREVRGCDGVGARFDPDLPVIVLSGRGAEADRIRGLSEGADAYLTKPFAYGELLATIRAVLRRRLAERRPLARWPGRRDPAARAGRPTPSPGHVAAELARAGCRTAADRRAAGRRARRCRPGTPARPRGSEAITSGRTSSRLPRTGRAGIVAGQRRGGREPGDGAGLRRHARRQPGQHMRVGHIERLDVHPDPVGDHRDRAGTGGAPERTAHSRRTGRPASPTTSGSRPAPGRCSGSGRGAARARHRCRGPRRRAAGRPRPR